MESVRIAVFAYRGAIQPQVISSFVYAHPLVVRLDAPSSILNLVNHTPYGNVFDERMRRVLLRAAAVYAGTGRRQAPGGGVVNSKRYPTIGVCGIDCGLCPRYQTSAASRCPGCAPEGFREMGGQWCRMTRCAVRDRGYETCAECAEFPCYRFEGWDRGDSFVSHLMSIANLRAIQERSIEAFAAQQQARMTLLRAMLDEFDEGRSRSYCCVASALLPLDEIEEGLAQARREMREAGIAADDRKSRAVILHRKLDAAAERLGVSLRLRTGKKTSTGSPGGDPPSTK